MSTQLQTLDIGNNTMTEISFRLPDAELLSIGIRVKKREGTIVLLDPIKIRHTIERAIQGFEQSVSIELLEKECLKNIFDGIATKDIEQALILAAASFIERDPAYDSVAVRLFLQTIYKSVFGLSITPETLSLYYQQVFIKNIKIGIETELFDKRLAEFDLEYLAQALRPERDELFTYLGMQTLHGRYFLKIDGKIAETPQAFWMRIAMGLAVLEPDQNEAAIKFYEVMSTLRYLPSTPTLFHAGLLRAQLSSCFLSTISDDLAHIFKVLGDNAQLSKWAGGIGNDWTNIRAVGSLIKGIKATSQGTVPFLKIANDVVAGITKSGIRRGGTCAYLETWHLDIEDFLDLRRNTGDERRRTHDMNTANWIPDLFLKRVRADESWTLFSPDETPDLHGLYGKAFERRYQEYEQMARDGKIRNYKVIPAKQLWRKMLTRLFETGHPWITFKDPSNIRSPQDHAGVVNSSNLCTEIILNTSADETAVCNLGSVNLARHLDEDGINEALLAETIRAAIRMLDNVIDLNFYPTIEARNSNIRHRPVGLGIMGLQDVLFMLDMTFSDTQVLEVAGNIMEMVSYYAILTSSELAKERGAYQSYRGSKWDRGLFPLDTVALLEQERGLPIQVSRTSSLNWQPVREHVKKWGMRNSNTMAIAPTATISNIAGCYPSIEPMYSNLYVKANISGEFTIVNTYLVEDLKALDLWNQDMLDQIKYFDGNIQNIEQIPAHIRAKYKGAFDIDQKWLIQLTAERGKWIDQAQSHNVFFKGESGKELDEIFMTAWNCGLKTTYYLRTLGASQIEKSTLDASKFGFTQKREYKAPQAQEAQEITSPIMQEDLNQTTTANCRLDNPECEVCQ